MLQVNGLSVGDQSKFEPKLAAAATAGDNRRGTHKSRFLVLSLSLSLSLSNSLVALVYQPLWT